MDENLKARGSACFGATQTRASKVFQPSNGLAEVNPEVSWRITLDVARKLTWFDSID